MKRYRKLLIALAAVAAVYLARETGLDGGLIDQVLEALVDTLAPLESTEVPYFNETPSFANSGNGGR